MSALGLYLLVSLLFVVGTLFELGIVLEVKRICDNKIKNKVRPNQRIIKVKALNQQDVSDLDLTKLKVEKIDRIAFIVLLVL